MKKSLLDTMREIFITKEIFDIRFQELINRITPLEKLWYGFIALALTTIGIAWLGLIIKTH